jgi:hypothetical protein
MTSWLEALVFLFLTVFVSKKQKHTSKLFASHFAHNSYFKMISSIFFDDCDLFSMFFGIETSNLDP